VPRNDSIDLVIGLGGDGRRTAERIARALEGSPDPASGAPKLAGRISFPHVTLWRLRKGVARGPLARFEGSVQPSSNGSVLAGRVSILESVSSIMAVITGLTLLMFVVALASFFAAGPLTSLVAWLLFAVLSSAYLFVARRTAKANSAAEAELLIRELREVVSDSLKL
jgi:hypothetical protein